MSDLVLCTLIFCVSAIINVFTFCTMIVILAWQVKVNVNLDKKLDVDVDSK